MFKQLLITALLTFAVGVASAGKMTLLEEAAEFESLSVRVSGNGKGNIRLQSCDECEELRLKLSAATTLQVAGKSLPLSSLNKYTLYDGTVFFRPGDNVITRIEAAR